MLTLMEPDHCHLEKKVKQKLDPVGSTVRYEVMKLIIDVTWSVEGIYAFIY